MTEEELRLYAEAHAPSGCALSKAVNRLIQDVELLRAVRDAQRALISKIDGERTHWEIVARRYNKILLEVFGRVPEKAPEEVEPVIVETTNYNLNKIARDWARRVSQGLAPLDDFAQGAK